MKIVEVTVRQLKMRLKSPFSTSFGTLHNREFLLVEAKDESGHTGWGEGVAFTHPWYTEETLKTSQHMLEDVLIPLLLNNVISHPDEVSNLFRPIRKNNMAKASIEGAIWDLYAKMTNQTLANALGGNKEKIEVGVSIGIQERIDDLLVLIDGYAKEGYKRIKVKIKPGHDVEVIREIRKTFPHIPLMADANSAYTLKDGDVLKELDRFNLMMIEQPLSHDDIVDHAKLQAMLKTPICLDESITSYDDARKAIELNSCGVINVKIGRVGGLTESKRIHDLCKKQGVPMWCGGMFESGIGRAHNIALTSLSNFVMPGDTSGSNRYYEEDIVLPEVIVEDGFIAIPTAVGIGYEPNLEQIRKFTVHERTYRA